MAIPFNDTTNLKGAVQFYELECGFNQGDVSGDTTLLKQFAAEYNVAKDIYLDKAIAASGTWQVDDSNAYESDGTTPRGYQILTANLVSGQRDYKFLTDDYGNEIFDIHRVFVQKSATATKYTEIFPLDELDEDTDILTGSTLTGAPNGYGKLSNALFLDIPTDYNKTGGLKMVVSRGPSYVLYTDTTKTPGFYGPHDEYFYIRPAMVTARRKGLQNLPRLEKVILDYEGDERLGISGKITDYFSRRMMDETNTVGGEFKEYE